MGEDDESSTERPGGEDGSTFDGVLQEIARAPSREPPPVAQVPDPEQIAHFRIEGRLGQGAMGIVYRARDTSLQRTVALKVLPGGFERDETRRARFLREARAAAALNHPNLAAVYEVGQVDGRIYIAMEHVPGQSLRELLAERRPTVEESLRIARQIAAALAHAHTAGVIHRDLKPDNVMVGSSGVVKVLDFGLAKVQQSGDGSNLDTETGAGQVMGTPAYMAPEQWRGSQVTAAADVFAFGVILFEMLTGERPFRGESGIEVEPVAASDGRVTPDVDRLVGDCLVKMADRRIADGAALEARLTEVDRVHPRGAKQLTGAGRKYRLGPLLLATLALGGVLALRMNASRRTTSAPTIPTTPSAAALAPLPSASSKVTTMINLPAPVSTSADALRRYQLAMGDLRRASYTPAAEQLHQATALDPSFAAAHLRLALWEQAPSEFRETMRLRDSLDARDQSIFHAVEPMALEVPPDLPEVIARLTKLAAEHPDDAEILFYQGTLELEVDMSASMATLGRVLLLDPGMASAEDQMGWAALKNDEPTLALDHFHRCLTMSPGAVSCLRHAAHLEARLGHCAAFTEAARQALVIEPSDYFSQMTWVTARLVAGATLDESRALIDNALSSSFVRHADPGERGFFEARRAVAYWFGAFDEALRLGYEGIDASAGSEESDLGSRLAALEELGREREVVPAIRLYLSLRDTMGEKLDGVALRVLRQRGEEAELRKLRDEWLRAPRLERRMWRRDVSPQRDLADWAKYYGVATTSSPDAVEALQEQAHFLTIPLNALDADEKEEIGRVYLLAGRPQEALTPLREAAKPCEPFEYNRMVSFVAPMVRARYELGLAEEAVGDPTAACAAYATVIERWGNATPKSKTADQTRARMKALACPPSPLTPR